jgi:rubrerythrin
MHKTSRSAFLRVGAGGAAALLVPGTAWASPARETAAAALPDGDLAYLRLLVGAELLAIDFQTKALATKKLDASLRATFRRLLADEKAHYAGLSKLLVDAGQVTTDPGDVDFAYPRGSFASRTSIARLGWRIESILVGSYLGAIESVVTPDVRLPIGQIAANESQHLSTLGPPASRARIGRAFPTALSTEAASTALDAFES